MIDVEEAEYLWSNLVTLGVLNELPNRRFEVNPDALHPFDTDETPVMKLPVAFCYSLVYQALSLILSQDHAVVLKKGLLFIYHHADLFVGQYRKEVGVPQLLHV